MFVYELKTRKNISESQISSRKLPAHALNWCAKPEQSRQSISSGINRHGNASMRM